MIQKERKKGGRFRSDCLELYDGPMPTDGLLGTDKHLLFVPLNVALDELYAGEVFYIVESSERNPDCLGIVSAPGWLQ